MADKRTFWQKLSNWQRGLIIGFVFLLIGFIYYAVDSYHYTGTCGESMMSGAESNKHQCALMEYLRTDYWDDFGFLLSVLVKDFWYVVFALFAAPGAVGYFIDVSLWGKK